MEREVNNHIADVVFACVVAATKRNDVMRSAPVDVAAVHGPVLQVRRTKTSKTAQAAGENHDQ